MQKNLLTFNGIKPQIIYTIKPEERETLQGFLAGEDKNHAFAATKVPDAIQPFAAAFLRPFNALSAWGATPLEAPHVALVAKNLKKGELSRPADNFFHSDAQDAAMRLVKFNIVRVRALAVSSNPAAFVDVTRDLLMAATLTKFRVKDREYSPQLLEWAKARGELVNPPPWSVIIFDENTPHRPRGVVEDSYRVLMNAWAEMKLPKDWRERIKSGDKPVMVPTHG